MGYKSKLRSINAGITKMNRQAEVSRNNKARYQNKLQKQIDLVYKKISKIEDSLKGLLAKGKITQNEYETLQERMNDIDVTLIIFGKKAGEDLGKRYVKGDIDKEEFDSILSTILPEGLLEERESLHDMFEKRFKDIDSYMFDVEKGSHVCNKCNKKPGLFSSLKNVQDYSFCSSCASVLKSLIQFPANDLEFFYNDPVILELDPSNRGSLPVGVHNKYLLT